MIEKRRVLVSAVMSVLQVAVSGAALFVLYRYLFDTLGAAQLGVWGMVLATASVNQLANLGLAGSAVMFVARYRARQQPGEVDAVIQTSVVSIAAFMAVVLLAAYPLLGVLIRWAVADAARVPLALSVLPYALVSFWLASVGGVVLSVIDGFERVDLRNVLTMAATVLYPVLAFVLVPAQGLVGLARAQVAQSALLALGGWLVLRRLFPALPLLPHRWHRRTFSEMLRYNVQFQITSVAQMLFDPTTRTLIVRLGGLEAAGLYEMASKMVVQLRAFVVTAHQAMVPTIANLQETAPELLRDVYAKSFRLILYLVLPSLPLLVALAPVISALYVGAYEPRFVLYADLLLAGWFLNLLSAPAYFANLGTGALRGNVLGHLVIGVLNAALGAGLGAVYGGTGVVAGFVAALLAGNGVTMVLYHRAHGIRLADVVERESLVLGAVSLAALLPGLLLYDRLGARWGPAATGLAIVAVYLAFVAGPLWTHSMRERLTFWIHRVLLARTR